MTGKAGFIEQINSGYGTTNAHLSIGKALLNGQVIDEAEVRLPLRTMNRHGLIAGATGTGKTVTLQMIAQKLSQNGVPSLLLDIKGDLSGLAMPGDTKGKAAERCAELKVPFQPEGSPVEFFALSKQDGVRLRATVSEFGPVLFSKVLALNATQSGVIALLFKYADDNHLPLLDLKDFKQLIQHAGGDAKKEIQKTYGNISPASMSTILRKIIELESQGAEHFFGERSFEVEDLARVNNEGKGVISVIRLNDMQDKPNLFSTFMLSLLAEVYQVFPEAGDAEKPRLCIFIDEAHLVFSEAQKALLQQIENIVKLIRSKGVGLFFITQNPNDIPEEVLAQLGLKVQHALRAFTEKDRKAIRKAAENYPSSAFYKTDELLTSLGIGQALVTALNEKGIPTPLAAVHLEPPPGRIGILKPEELQSIISKSALKEKYNNTIDRESAYEILTRKLNETEAEEEEDKKPEQSKRRGERSLLEQTGGAVARQVGRTVAQELTRGLLGVLGIRSNRKRRNSWF
jgi:DNA helicase HerA-like ATPase